jgi:RHS repeat-associated protein
MANSLGESNPIRYRGYVYDAETGLYYLQSHYYDPTMGQFINTDGVMGVTSDMCSYNLFAYCGNNPVVRFDAAGASWATILAIKIHLLNNIAIAIGIDTAAIGAQYLDMAADGAGVYHADFDCWQQYFGYNYVYDVVFATFTSIESARFSFTYMNTAFTIWAWKGNYINLGAGAELGFYLGDGFGVSVHKSLAVKMSMGVAYNFREIINYMPQHRQWWITGFNPDYQNVFAHDLTACFVLEFTNRGMYLALKQAVSNDTRWTFYDSRHTAVFTF